MVVCLLIARRGILCKGRVSENKRIGLFQRHFGRSDRHANIPSVCIGKWY